VIGVVEDNVVEVVIVLPLVELRVVIGVEAIVDDWVVKLEALLVDVIVVVLDGGVVVQLGRLVVPVVVLLGRDV
jgi:hypothetical protein